MKLNSRYRFVIQWLFDHGTLPDGVGRKGRSFLRLQGWLEDDYCTLTVAARERIASGKLETGQLKDRS